MTAKIFLISEDMTNDIGEPYYRIDVPFSYHGIKELFQESENDYLGISYGDCFFEYNDDYIREDDILSLMKKYDVILPYSSFIHVETNRRALTDFYGEDLVANIKHIIECVCPDYETAFEACMDSRMYIPGHMFIMNKMDCVEYCTWLCLVLDKLQLTNSPDMLIERLFRVWLMMHRLKIREISITPDDPKKIVNPQLVIDKLNRYITLHIEELITIYKSGNYIDVYEFEKKNIGFGDRIPVWICWWQGFDSAPPIVKACRKSIYDNLDRDVFDIREITFNNLDEYVFFPDWIVDKYQKGIITLTQLSDILRMALLYYYGGAWIDSTYFIAHKIGKCHVLATRDFFSIKVKNLSWRRAVSKGEYAGNFLKTSAGHLLPKFVMNAFYYYYLKYDRSADYFMIEHFIRIAADIFTDVYNDIYDVPYVGDNVNELVDHLNDEYSDKHMNELVGDTDFFKLNYRLPLKEKNYFDRETIYGHLISGLDYIC